MKCVGIIGAMEQEVARLKEVMENVSITTRAGMDFYEGVLEGKKVVVVQSGIGKGKCRHVHPDPGRSLSGGSGDQYRYRRKP